MFIFSSCSVVSARDDYRVGLVDWNMASHHPDIIGRSNQPCPKHGLCYFMWCRVETAVPCICELISCWICFLCLHFSFPAVVECMTSYKSLCVFVLHGWDTICTSKCFALFPKWGGKDKVLLKIFYFCNGPNIHVSKTKISLSTPNLLVECPSIRIVFVVDNLAKARMVNSPSACHCQPLVMAGFPPPFKRFPQFRGVNFWQWTNCLLR